jgi:hypothetical protein
LRATAGTLERSPVDLIPNLVGWAKAHFAPCPRAWARFALPILRASRRHESIRSEHIQSTYSLFAIRLPPAPASFIESEAAITANATSAIMIVQTALTSGFTPRRTSE